MFFKYLIGSIETHYCCGFIFVIVMKPVFVVIIRLIYSERTRVFTFLIICSNWAKTFRNMN